MDGRATAGVVETACPVRVLATSAVPQTATTAAAAA